jgi:Cu/Ag efflux protein CusF
MTTPRIAFALLAGLMFAVTASAAEVRGVVSRIDPDKKELVLEERGLGVRGTVLVFALPDQTPVLFGDQPAALSDVQVGRRVRVEYELDDGRQVVQMIHVLGGPKPPPPPTVTPPIAPINGDALTGVLRHVGYSDREVTVVGPGAKGAQTETTLAVPESARIVKNGKEATLDDLKEGDTGTVQVEKKDGRPTAAVVQVGAGSAAEKTTSKTIPRLRFLLKIADQLLQGMENDKDR